MKQNENIQALTVTDLKTMSTKQLLALFKQLDTPTIEEMQGEYRACLLRQPHLFATLNGYLLENPIFNWQSKAFRPLSQDEGCGYNTFLVGGRIIQKFPMKTLIVPSRYDGKPAYSLIYRQYHSLCADINMVDEVRKVREGVYLGIGTWGFWHDQRQQAYPFLLEGPVHTYRGDIGKARKGFSPGKKEIPAG